MKISWGILGPETLSNERRTRTLGLGASVRAFNDLAVPGLGNVWFGKQLFLATLGVALAERTRGAGKNIQNIETANAIEAIACWWALKSNGWKPDARLRGATKMQGKNDISFAAVRKRDFYVSQPMRMATVQPLPALGIVNTDGNRFNAFTSSQYGHDLIEAQFAGYSPDSHKGSFEALANWTMDKTAFSRKNMDVQEALSPLVPMSIRAGEILRERLIQGSNQENMADKERRRAALAWVESLRDKPNQKLTWENKPIHIDDAHWQDLIAGALFFSVRDAAIRLLDRLEAHIGNQKNQRFSLDDPIPDSVKPDIQTLRNLAKDFLDKQHKDELANSFCRECVNENDTVLLISLIGRDERVLRIRDRVVLPGPAFRGSTIPEDVTDQFPEGEVTETNITDAIEWPDGISTRIRNLFLLNLDLHGKLSDWLGGTPNPEGGVQ